MKPPVWIRLLPYYFYSLSRIWPQKAADQAFRLFASPIKFPRPASEMQVYNSANKIWLKSGLRAYRWGDAKSPMVVLLHGWNLGNIGMPIVRASKKMLVP